MKKVWTLIAAVCLGFGPPAIPVAAATRQVPEPQRRVTKKKPPSSRSRVLWRIDVGNTAPYTDAAGNVWSSDVGMFDPERAFPESRGTPPIAGAADPTIYRTYRGNVGGQTPQAERYLTFRIPVKGHRRVDVRLHFAELYWGAPGGGKPGPGKRVVDLEAGGRTVLKDFDITRESGGALTALVKEIKNVAVQNGVLTLTFRPVVDFPSIAGIEVLAPRQ